MSKLSEREYAAGIRPMGYEQMTNLQLLRLARKIIKHGSWCQGSNALNAAGLPVPPTSKDAVAWCERGACIRALQPNISVLTVDLHTNTSKVSKQIAAALGFDTCSLAVQWNDTQDRTKKEVLSHLSARIAAFEDKHQLERT